MIVIWRSVWEAGLTKNGPPYAFFCGKHRGWCNELRLAIDFSTEDEAESAIPAPRALYILITREEAETWLILARM